MQAAQNVPTRIVKNTKLCDLRTIQTRRKLVKKSIKYYSRLQKITKIKNEKKIQKYFQTFSFYSFATFDAIKKQQSKLIVTWKPISQQAFAIFWHKIKT